MRLFIFAAVGAWCLTHAIPRAFVGSRRTLRRFPISRAVGSGQLGPAKVKSLAGRKARQLLLENPALFKDSLESELQALAGDTAEGTGSAQGEDFAASLRRRIQEVRESERGLALSELIYLVVCDGFREAAYSLVRPLQAGRTDLGIAKEESLTGMLSPELLEAVEDHLAQSMPGEMASKSSKLLQQTVQLPLFNIGQAYALTVQYGYVLRRADARLQLERNLGGSETLSSYMKSFGPGAFQDAMISVEAHIAAKIQVEALFGDLKSLRSDLLSALQKRKATSREATSQALQDAVNSGEVAGIFIRVSDVRRLLLEAAVFGTLLWQAEAKALAVSRPTPTTQPRLSDFGVETDRDGNPKLPK